MCQNLVELKKYSKKLKFQTKDLEVIIERFQSEFSKDFNRVKIEEFSSKMINNLNQSDVFVKIITQGLSDNGFISIWDVLIVLVSFIQKDWEI